MTVSSGIVGTLVWGMSCLGGFCYLIIHDGCGYLLQGNVHIISNIYEVYLFCQFVCSLLNIINSTINSTALTYIYVILMSFAAYSYMVLPVLWTLGPSGYRVDRVITFILPIIYCAFLIALILVSEQYALYVLFALYLPAASSAYTSLWIMYYWFKNETTIFEKIEDRQGLNRYFVMALFAGTIGMVDFIYPAFSALGWLPDDHVTLWTRTCDALLYVPFIIPLIRYLNQMEWYSKKNVMRLLQGARFQHEIILIEEE